MVSPHLQGLVVLFRAAKEARARARNQVRLMEEYLSELEIKRREAQATANAHQHAHDLAHRLYLRARIAGMHAKAQKKAEKRDLHGRAAKAARIERDKYQAQIDDGVVQQAWLEAEVDVPTHDAHFYDLRHQMMLARQEHECGNAEALERKRAYMRAADIPADIKPDEVLYYPDGRNIHLFYAGGKDFYDNGTSPDGVGHGHVMLRRNRQNVYYPDYTRLPGQ